MSSTTYASIVRDALWTNNPALVAVLGLCPTLAVTSSAVECDSYRCPAATSSATTSR